MVSRIMCIKVAKTTGIVSKEYSCFYWLSMDENEICHMLCIQDCKL